MSRQVDEGTVVQADKDVFSCELGGGQALLDLRSSTYYSINSVGSHVWELLQKPIAVGQIQASVVETFDVEPDRCRNDVMALIGQFADAGLIQVQNEKPA